MASLNVLIVNEQTKSATQGLLVQPCLRIPLSTGRRFEYYKMPFRVFPALIAFVAFTSFLQSALAADQQPLTNALLDHRYKYGDPIPVSCLNRTIDNGQHVTDEKGRLQYVPFPTCNETGRPLELYFGVEKG